MDARENHMFVEILKTAEEYGEDESDDEDNKDDQDDQDSDDGDKEDGEDYIVIDEHNTDAIRAAGKQEKDKLLQAI